MDSILRLRRYIALTLLLVFSPEVGTVLGTVVGFLAS